MIKKVLFLSWSLRFPNSQSINFVFLRGEFFIHSAKMFTHHGQLRLVTTLRSIQFILAKMDKEDQHFFDTIPLLSFFLFLDKIKTRFHHYYYDCYCHPLRCYHDYDDIPSSLFRDNITIHYL